LQPDCDKLQEVKLRGTAFREFTFHDPDRILIVQHVPIIEAWETHVGDQEAQFEARQLSKMFPQLIINRSIVTNKYLKSLFTLARDSEIQMYLCTKNSWSPRTFESIVWIAHGKALSQLMGRQR
jgi:hypothetical protein